MDKNDLINKFLQIEQLAYRGRHLVEVMATDKMVVICRNIRRDLQDLEVEFGRRINDTVKSQEDAHKA